jgi:hypothetical protein
MNIKELLLRGRETIAEREDVKRTLRRAGGKDVNKGFTTGATKGESSIKNYVKTIYDPKIWTDSKLEKALKEALLDCNNKGNMIEDKLTSGITKDGYEIEFIIRDQKVKTFYFK